jgi:hypothetical protein
MRQTTGVLESKCCCVYQDFPFFLIKSLRNRDYSIIGVDIMGRWA